MDNDQPESAKTDSRPYEPEYKENKRAEEALKERLRFELFLSNLSARFINLAPDQIDHEIQDALRQILEFFHVDRCGLVRVQVNDMFFRITHAVYAPDIPPVPENTDLPITMFPWVYEKLTKRHELVSFTTRDELPREAAIDRQTYERLEVRSALNIPILIDAEAVYTININAVRKECAWPQDYFPRLRLLGEILVNSLQLAKTRKQLRDRLRFEELISNFSAGFVNISSKQIEGQINNCLRQITEFFAADRCTLGLLSEDGTQLERAFEYHVEGVEPGPSFISKDQLPWYISQLVQGILVVINRLEDLPAEAEAERRLCLAKSMKSFVSIPMRSGRRTLGSCALVSERAERVWPEELIKRMRLIAEVLSGALARKRFEESLRESEERLNLAATSAEAGLWVLDFATGHIWATEKARDLYGFSADQELNFEGYIQVVHPEDREKIRCSVKRTMQTRSDFREEYRIAHPNGTIRWMAARGRPYFHPSGEPGRLMGVSIDISERKQMEEKLQQRLHDIEQLKQQLEKENIYLREEIELQSLHEEIVGRSPAMKQILAQVEQVARTDATVLIEGETGTGKELLARTLHRLSARGNRPLVTVNCAALPPTLIESELFGREKGAYTGALTRMTGRFEVADGATLFLDEIGELPQDVQAKLLRVLEQGRFERLGSTKPLQVNVRIIAASNRDLARTVEEGNFRRDLYYRLNVFPITVPPLRERPDDIPLLVWAFVRKYEKKMGRRIEHIPRKSMEALQRYPWPGNARELRNTIEHAMIVSSGKTLEINIPERTSSEIPVNLSLEEVERRHILKVLQKSGWRLSGQGGAAEILDLKRTTLQSKMKKLGIRRPAK